MKTLNETSGVQSVEAKDWPLRLKSVAFVFFLLFLFFLPLYEAPKNIFSVLFVFLGGWVAFYRENAAQRFKSKDLAAWAFLLLAMSPFAAGWNSVYMDLPSRLSSALNWALMPLVSVIFILVNFSKRYLLWVFRSLCLGFVIAVGEAFYSWSGEYPELNSVGHVNQSALYAVFCLMPAGLLLMRSGHKLDLLVGLTTISAVFYYQAFTLSLVGFGASSATIGGMGIIYCWNRKFLKTLFGSLALGFLTVLFVVTQPSHLFGPYENLKQELDKRWSSKNHFYAQRDKLVSTAIEVAGDSLTGFGLGSFGAATQPSNLKKIVETRGKDWLVERGNYFSSSHGHNLFANVLVERGWIGVFSVGIFLGYLVAHFRRNMQFESGQVGMLAITIICLAGLGQSTLHVEHGQLALLCLAICVVASKVHTNLVIWRCCSVL